MTKPWLTILGIGDDGLLGLHPLARQLFDQAHHVIVSKRIRSRLTQSDIGNKTVQLWTTDINALRQELHERRGDAVTVLATGDPFHFGIAASLSKSIAREEMTVIPHPSGFSLAANRLGWPLQDVECLSLHGRAISRLHPSIEPGNRILALTSDASTPHKAAKLLVERGFEPSIVTVLEHIGGSRERSVKRRADAIRGERFADFNMLALECKTGRNPLIRPRLAGLDNTVFRHDGQLTKREVRAVTLAALCPYPHALLWDIGAGVGSVAIEWMRASRSARAIAFEQNHTRLAMLRQNALALGVPDIEIVEGKAPQSLKSCAAPDAVFIGGGLTCPGLFDVAWQALRGAGRLVANTVTLEGEKRLIDLHERLGGALTRLDIASVTNIGRLRGLEPRMSVLQWQVTKL